MKRTSLIWLAILIVSLSVVFESCVSHSPEDGSLDEIKAYMPDNKYFKTGFKGLHFVLETHALDKVDTIFWKLINSYNLPTTCDSVADGTFTGESPYDAFDYKHVVTLTIKGGKITKVDYNEVHKDGSDKKTDKEYNEKMLASGTSPEIAYPEMEKQLLEKQKVWEVDATSGASYSLYRFRYAVTLALMKAEMKKRKHS